jgi:predicted nucleic acid-binding protein
MTVTNGTNLKELVDTNVFIYASDPAAGEKRMRAEALLERLIIDGVLAVSVQVLNELFHAATRPNEGPSLKFEVARRIIQDLADSASVVPLTSSVTFRAVDAIPRHSLSFWDALIWAAAREHDLAVIHTEDFQDGHVVEGVRFSNPFAG